MAYAKTEIHSGAAGYIIKEGNMTIACVYTNLLKGTLSDEEALKKAKLYVAADDLLKACELAKGMLNHVQCVQGCNNGVIHHGADIEQCQWCDEKNRIDQAINKAQ